MVTMEDKASVALFTPSKMMAMEWDMNPDGHLEGDEQRIADNAVDARLDDFPLAVHDSHP